MNDHKSYSTEKKKWEVFMIFIFKNILKFPFGKQNRKNILLTYKLPGILFPFHPPLFSFPF